MCQPRLVPEQSGLQGHGCAKEIFATLAAAALFHYSALVRVDLERVGVSAAAGSRLNRLDKAPQLEDQVLVLLRVMTTSPHRHKSLKQTHPLGVLLLHTVPLLVLRLPAARKRQVRVRLRYLYSLRLASVRLQHQLLQ